MKYLLAPSVLAADFLHLESEIRRAEKAGASYLHFDVMDGVFVPNISFGMPVLRAVSTATSLTVDVHAMIVEPRKYIRSFAESGADIITLHYEALKEGEIGTALDEIHAIGKRAGLSVKPKTPVSVLFPYLDKLDQALIMTVEPGFGGQKFMEERLDAIRELRNYADKHGRDLNIEVDGGINRETLKLCLEAGANVFVLGTAFFGADPAPSADDLL